MEKVHENLISVTQYDIYGKLPDPFLADDGKRIASRADWGKRRNEMYRTVVELQYGTQPPAPEVFKVEALDAFSRSFRITAGTKKRTVSFTMRVFRPQGQGSFPAVVDGDLGFDYAYCTDFIQTFLDHGVMPVMFNRTELVPDRQDIGRTGPLYEIYPEYTFGAIGAWAWGYSRCVDALEQLGIADMDTIAFTGHSRGAKTAMLAGILDERASIVNPNETNAGSCSCYRTYMKALTEDGEEQESETLAALTKVFPYWMGPEMKNYADRPQELPFDAHFTKAMIAPRYLLVGEAASDIWTNPIGTWQTTLAAKEVYRFLGAEEKLLWYFRKGYHYHKVEDVENLIAVIEHKKKGTPLPDGFFITPFRPTENIFDWHMPEKQED